MLEVDISKILPVTEARDSLNKIIDDVSAGDELYVLTVNGKPSAVVVGVHHLEKLTGKPTEELINAATPPTGLNNITPPAETPAVAPVTPITPPAFEPTIVETAPVVPSTPPLAPLNDYTPPPVSPVTPTVPSTAPAPDMTSTPPTTPAEASQLSAPTTSGEFVTPNSTDIGATPNAGTSLADDLFSNDK